MSDPYLDKLDAQRAEREACQLCKQEREKPKEEQSSTPLMDHLQFHREEMALRQIDAPTYAEEKPELNINMPGVYQSDSTIEYSHDVPCESYAYKSKGMTDAAAMHKGRWKGS